MLDHEKLIFKMVGNFVEFSLILDSAHFTPPSRVVILVLSRLVAQLPVLPYQKEQSGSSFQITVLCLF